MGSERPIGLPESSFGEYLLIDLDFELKPNLRNR